MPLTIATCTPLPEPDPDEQILLDALARRGVTARVIPWNAGPPPTDGPVVIRSTWDYHHALPAFLAWCAAIPRLYNPLPLAAWSAHKSYLLDLAAAGVPVVPTVYLAPGQRGSLASITAALGWEQVVVKPAVGAGSWGAKRLFAGEGETHLAELLANRGALIQPFMAEVEREGERAVVWIDGQITHCVRKSPRLSGDHESVSGALPVAPDEAVVVDAALALAEARTGARPLYARIDLVRDEAGQPRVMELELLEPSLFLAQHPPALERLADALARLESR